MSFQHIKCKTAESFSHYSSQCSQYTRMGSLDIKSRYYVNLCIYLGVNGSIDLQFIVFIIYKSF